MSTFRQYGGINYAATNNIVRNKISNSDNLGISNIMGLPNTTITCLSNFVVSQESNFYVTGNAIIDGTLEVAGATTLSSTLEVAGATTFDGPVIVNYDNTNQVLGYSASTNLGINNTGFGYNVFKSAIANSNNNVAIGSFSLYSLTSGENNVSVGVAALYSLTTATSNTAIGYQSLFNTTTGIDNIAIGEQSGLANTTGQNNVFCGSNSGDTNTTGSYNTFLGANTKNSPSTTQFSTAVGFDSQITASNQIVLGTSAEYVYIPGTTASTTTTSGALQVIGGVGVGGAVTAASFNSSSDYRIKENIKVLSESFTIDNLRPVTYYNTSINKQDIGFIAHEVQEFFPYLVNGEKDGETNQSLNYNGLVGLLVKEIQDLKQQVNNLKIDIQNFKNVISEILPRIK